jgi:hypothetical protein
MVARFAMSKIDLAALYAGGIKLSEAVPSPAGVPGAIVPAKAETRSAEAGHARTD